MLPEADLLPHLIWFVTDRFSSTGSMMRRISMTTRDELVAVAGRYAQEDWAKRGRILDEFAAVTRFHRKHAMRLLRAGQGNRRSGQRGAGFTPAQAPAPTN
jgi:hypothetical protein